MKYTLTIKSHTDYPDYEHSLEAKTKEEAAFKFMRGLTDWAVEDLLPNIEAES